MIEKDLVVAMNYTLTDGTGNVLDQSSGEPLHYLHGHDNIIPGLEKAMTGMAVGEKKRVEVPAKEAYGEYDPELCFALGRDAFGARTPEPGMVVELSGPGGRRMMARILEVAGEEIKLDPNHPLAGKDLTFDVEVTGVRPATPEELSHGHVHGPGGHHHH